MIAKFTQFFIQNEKISTILILIISLFGLIAYILLPKQYNPSIVAPAFLIEIPASSYTSHQGYEYIIKSLEDKIGELSGIDQISGYSTDGYVSVMVSFDVGIDQEIAKTRLYDKLYSSQELKPYNIESVNIRSIDPEDLPQVSYAIIMTGSVLEVREAGQYLRNIAQILKENITTVEDVSAIEIIGGYNENITIELIPERIEDIGGDILAIVSKLQNIFGNEILGNISNDTNIRVTLTNKVENIKQIKNLVIQESADGSKVLLQEIAKISVGPIDIKKFYHFVDKYDIHNAVFIGVAKQKGSNSVHVVENIHKVVEEVQKKLPKNIQIITIQDEGETALHATNELMFHLFVSIVIVFVILVLFLGIRDAINAAFCIPMVLAIVFIIAYIIGLDINRITLFALILSLGILVDDSIVMVENNARHLSMMSQTGRSKVQAILDSVEEVGVSIILSTITRIISFLAMFAVTGMMGDYMKPIPIFATIALLASLLVAFSINPFLASLLVKKGNTHHEQNEGKFLLWYGEKLGYFVNLESRSKSKRIWLKRGFWISLILILIVPIFLGVFKARMLPKADKDQVYIWIDAPKYTTAETMSNIAKDVEIFLMGYKKEILPDSRAKYTRILDSKLRILSDISLSIGDRMLPDFANLFRSGNMRVQENQISIRLNLIKNSEREMTSEEFVIELRPQIREFLLKKYPDLSLRILEDPPGPPTQATFHIKVQGEEGVSESELVKFASVIGLQVKSIQDEEKIVDITTSFGSTNPSFEIALDNTKIGEFGLDEGSIKKGIQLYFSLIPLAYSVPEEGHYGEKKIVVGVGKTSTDTISDFKKISFLNQNQERIYLDQIATFRTAFQSSHIYSDNKQKTIHIGAEMGENSVVYPVIRIYKLLSSEDFERSTHYKKISSNPYGIKFLNTEDGKYYFLNWGGEWELTMDTFRDLSLAMLFSLFIIYFIIVTQFGSFLVGGLVMTTFLLSFFGIFPGFSLLYVLSGTYFTATAMIGAIALGGIVVGNALILIDYINQLIHEGKSLEYAVIEGSKKRFIPVMLTSIAAVAGSFIITSDPVWSGLAWSIIWGLSASAILTLYLIPIFYYSYLREHSRDSVKHIQESEHMIFSGVFPNP